MTAHAPARELRLTERQAVAIADPCQRADETLRPHFVADRPLNERLRLRSILTVNR